MDYEDEFEEDEDAESFNRRYRINDTKTLPTLIETRLRHPIEDNTLMTMSYKGSQVRYLSDNKFINVHCCTKVALLMKHFKNGLQF